MGLQRLLQEPQRLSEEMEKINQELETLIIENYKVFVENLTCSMQLQSEEAKLEQISGKLEKTTANLQEVCVAFKERVQAYVTFHKRNRTTLQHHQKLLELLEVPQLVEACVRNGFFDEAIELANFINGLERRHLLAAEVKGEGGGGGGAGVQAVIQTIVSEIQEILSGVAQQLLLQFTETNSLPRQIQMIAVLRKLDVLTVDRFLSFERFDHSSSSPLPSLASASQEGGGGGAGQRTREEIRSRFLRTAELKHQMDFLEAKSAWLEKNLGDNSTRDPPNSPPPSLTRQSSHSTTSSSSHRLGPYGRAVEMLETRRTSLFSIITQFNALFLDHQLSSTSSSLTAKDKAERENSLSTTSAILQSWTTRQIAQFLADLKELLRQVEEGASVRSLFEQSLYFASRLSTVGADFTAAVLPVFEEVALTRLRKDMELTFSQFLTILQTEKISFDSSDGSHSELKEQVSETPSSSSPTPLISSLLSPFSLPVDSSLPLSGGQSRHQRP